MSLPFVLIGAQPFTGPFANGPASSVLGFASERQEHPGAPPVVPSLSGYRWSNTRIGMISRRESAVAVTNPRRGTRDRMGPVPFRPTRSRKSARSSIRRRGSA